MNKIGPNAAFPFLIKQYQKLSRSTFDAGQSFFEHAKTHCTPVLKRVQDASIAAIETGKIAYQYAKEKYSHVKDATISTCHWGRYQLKPAKNVDMEKSRIDRLARKGLERAAKWSVPVEPAPKMPAELELRVNELETVKFEPTEEKPDDRDYWQNQREKQEKTINTLCISSVIIYMMRKLSGIVSKTMANYKSEIERLKLRLRGDDSDKAIKAEIAEIERKIKEESEKENVELLSLANKTASGDNPPSAWSVFTQRYQLSLWQKIKVGLFYWLFHKSSIISTINKAYGISAFLNKKIIPYLSEDKNLSQVFRYFLDGSNQFVEGDVHAHRVYAEGSTGEDLERLRKKPILQFAGAPLKELCEDFFQKQTPHELPEIHLFPSWEETPVIKYLVKGLNWPINKLKNWFNKSFILPWMRDKILPPLLNTVIGNSLEATGSDKLPFSIVFTEFFIKQLTSLKESIEKGEMDDSTPPSVLPGTEKMPIVISRLMDILKLQPEEPSKLGDPLNPKKEHFTPRELQRIFKEQIDQIKYAAFQYVDKKTEEAMEGGAIQAGYSLFNYLNRTAQSGELVSKLLEQTIAPFSQNLQDPETLKRTYERKMESLGRLTNEVVNLLVKLSIKKMINGNPNDHAKEKTESTFGAWSIVAGHTLGEVTRVCNEAASKLNNARTVSDLDNLHHFDIQPNLASLFQMMEDLANKREGSSEIPNLKETNRDVVWRTIRPFYKGAIEIEKKALKLQKIHKQYAKIAQADIELKTALDKLLLFRNGVMNQPRHYEGQLNELVSNLKSPFAEIIKRERISKEPLQQMTAQVRGISDDMVRGQATLDALRVIWNQDDLQPGFVQQLHSYYVSGNNPRGYKPSKSTEGIRALLQYFTEEERAKLATIGNGSNLKSQWEDFISFFQDLHTKYSTLQQENKRKMNEQLDLLDRWIKDRSSEAIQIRKDEFEITQSMMDTLSKDVESWQKKLQKTESFSVPPTLTPTAKKTVGAVLAGGVASLGQAIGPGVALVTRKALDDGLLNTVVSGGLDTVTPMLVRSVLAAASGAILTNSTGIFSRKPAAIAQAIATGILAAGNSSLYMQAGIVAASAFAGWRHPKFLQAFGNDTVFPRVRTQIDKARTYMRDQIIYLAATTRALKAFS